MITSARAAKKEYAEKAFDLYGLNGCQFTIEEKLGVSELPRVGKKEGTSKGNMKPYSFPVIKLKISDGIFEKDLEMTEGEFREMSVAIPDTLINLQGLTLKVTRKPSGFGYKFEYIGIARQDMSGDAYQTGNHVTEQAHTQEAPSETGNQIKMLHGAVQMNARMGIDTDIKKLMIIAEAVRPGDAMGIIEAAKKEGWICEIAGKYRGT